MLMAITTICPLLACIPSQASSMPHAHCRRGKTPNPQPPCDNATPDCPYLLLEKSKSATIHLALPAPQLTSAAPIVHGESAVHTATYLPDEANTYLRNRVLRI